MIMGQVQKAARATCILTKILKKGLGLELMLDVH